MRVAAIQLCSTEDKKKNLQQALRLTRDAIARKARFIVLPEFFSCRMPTNPGYFLKDVVENIPGPSTLPFMDLARETKIFILAGSIYEKTATPEKAYDTAVFIDDKGRIAETYRKKNLFTANLSRQGCDEKKLFKAGQRSSMTQVLGFNLGFAICYDLRFPALFQEYSRRGCDVLAIPSAFTKETGEDHWEVLVRARAIETLSYVLAPNQHGYVKGGVRAYGNSMIVSPWGEILARAPAEGDAVIMATIRHEDIYKARRLLPGICERRMK